MVDFAGEYQGYILPVNMGSTPLRFVIAQLILSVTQLLVLRNGSMAQGLQGISSTCIAPKVYQGDSATVTCHFSADLSKTNNNFAVYHYKLDTGAEARVLDCYWQEKDKLKCSLPVSDYTFNGTVTDKVTIGIRRASLSFVGKFECKAEPSYPSDIQPCTFVLKEKPASTTVTTTTVTTQSQDSITLKDEPGMNSDNTVGIVVGVVIALALLAAVIIVFMCRRRIREKLPCLQQRHSKDTEKNLFETSRPLISSGEETEKDASTAAAEPGEMAENVAPTGSPAVETTNETDADTSGTTSKTEGDGPQNADAQVHTDEQRDNAESNAKLTVTTPEPEEIQNRIEDEHKRSPAGKKRGIDDTLSHDADKEATDARKDAENVYAVTNNNVETATSSEKRKEPPLMSDASPESATVPEKGDTRQAPGSHSLGCVAEGTGDPKDKHENTERDMKLETSPAVPGGVHPVPSKGDETTCPGPRLNLLFYQNQIESRPGGAYIDDIHRDWWSDHDLIEKHHQYIQWLFPTRDPPQRNLHAQELYPYEAEAIQNDKKAFERFIKSYQMMLYFFGLKLQDRETGEVDRAEIWKERFNHLQDRKNSHNFLRITRILTCLGEMGLEHYKAPLIRRLMEEAFHGHLSKTVESCRKHWIPTVHDEKTKADLEELATNLFGNQTS